VRDAISVGTKCSVPRLPDPVVHRPRLKALLADGVRCPVTLVSGPPGAGKTTLLVDWLQSERNVCTAWLTLDGRDDEPKRLAELVVETLGRAGAVAGRGNSSSSGEGILDTAFEQIMARGTSWVLVLEDVQEVRSPSALRTIGYLVERAPTSLDVILSSRADPPIGWGRLWLDGRLGQIRHADLAFSEAEAAELVAAHGVELSREDIATLWARTEGWAAGLRLAIGALQLEADAHAFVVDAATTEAAVSDYMLSEVLARQDDLVQDFLLRTCVAERLTPDLAVALTGDDRSGEVLLDLVQRGLFVLELEHRGWYRYHALFRALLQARLQQGDRDLAAELHRRAAAWHLAAGMHRNAETHARAAGEWALVGRLILDRWLQGTVREGDPFADDLLAGMAPDTILHTPELALVAATGACRWSRQEEADLYGAALDTMGPPATTKPGSDDPGTTWETARLLFDLTYGWSFGPTDRSRAAVATLRDLTVADASTPRLRQLAMLAQTEQDIDAGDIGRARFGLDELADQGEDGWHRTLASAALAVVDAATGLVRAAEDRVSKVLAKMEERQAQPTVHLAHLTAALCAAQRGEQRRATDAVLAAAAPMEWSSRSLRHIDRVVRASLAGTAPSFVRLDTQTASHPLAERALVALGVLQVIDAQGRAITVGGEGERLVLRARRQLAENALGQSEEAVAGWLDRDTIRHARTYIEAGVLAAIAAHQRDDHDAAGRRLSTALDLSMATGITVPLLAHGQHLEGLLEWTVDRFGPHTTGAYELLDRLRHPNSHGLVEPLTHREVEILQHLPTLMSNAEIAEGMHLSVNTVKTHLKSVYRKLGVDCRREAVRRGRVLELL
jgi:LuxR family maltose regulon positive regulatory protein